MPERSPEFAIVVATFYDDLAERLVNGATEAFNEGGIAPSSIRCIEVTSTDETLLGVG